MTVVVLVGPGMTEPAELARLVAAGRELTAFVDLAAVVHTLDPIRGLDSESRHLLGIDVAAATAAQLASDNLDVIVGGAGSYSDAAVYREGLLLVERLTMVALTAHPDRLAAWYFGRGTDLLGGSRGWRDWRANRAELLTSRPSFADFDVILDCGIRSRLEIVRLLTAAL